MRDLLLAILMVLLTTPAFAQEFDPFANPFDKTPTQSTQELNKHGEVPSTHEQALEYYDYCMTSRNRHMCTEAQDNFCGCAALRIREEMSRADMNTYNQSTASRDSATLIFVTRVVGPCLVQPVYENTFDKCLERKDLLESYSSAHIKICECAGDLMKRFAVNTAGAHASQMIASDFDGRSAYDRIFGSTKYRREQNRSVENCAVQFRRGEL